MGSTWLFYLLCGIAAGLVHVVFNSDSRLPTVGASGAIAGVMGAYLLKFPHSRIVTLVPIFFFLTTVEIPASVMMVYLVRDSVLQRRGQHRLFRSFPRRGRLVRPRRRLPGGNGVDPGAAAARPLPAPG